VSGIRPVGKRDYGRVPAYFPQVTGPAPRGSALGADRCAAVVEVELLDVEGEDLVGAGGGLVEHPPERLRG